MNSITIQPGDRFRIYCRHVAARGTVTKVNRKTIAYESVYMTGEVMRLKVDRRHLDCPGTCVWRQLSETQWQQLSLLPLSLPTTSP